MALSGKIYEQLSQACRHGFADSEPALEALFQSRLQLINDTGILHGWEEVTTNGIADSHMHGVHM